MEATLLGLLRDELKLLRGQGVEAVAVSDEAMAGIHPYIRAE